MATVEQRDTQTSGLATLPNTLDLYNDFKDDKDSDEESFHLPLLDCDDDLDSNTKEAASNNTGKDTDCQNAETEDDILNKFETTGTPDLDPKIEDKLLDELDEICGNDSEEKCTKQNVTETITSQKRGDEEVIGKSTNIENIPSELDELNPVKEFESQNKEPDEQTLNESCIESSLDTKSPCVTKEKEIKPECEEENDAVTKMHIRKEEINEEGTINSTDTDIIEIQDDGILDNFITIDELNDSKEDIDINNIKNSNDSDSKETVKERDVTTTKVPEEENGKPLQDTEIESTAEDKIVDFPEDETKNEDLHMEVDEPKTEINDTSKVETEDIAEVEQMEVENPDNATAVEIEHNAEAVESQNDTVTVVQDDDKIVDTQHDAKAIDAEGNEQNLKVQSNNQNTESEQNVQVDTSGFQNSSKSESVTIVSETTVPETTVSQSAVPKTTVSESVSETTASETTAAETTISETAASETTAPETTVPETTSEPELMDLDDSDIAEIEEKKCAESSDKVIESENMGVLEITDSDKQLETVDEEVEKSDTVDEEIKQIKTNSCSLEVEQPENSNDFNKNLDCEDLLDISVIRDADEDNASAIAENANDNQTSEKSDNDDQDEGSDKAENELDETDIDQDDTLLATEKEERMDFEDGNSSNLVYQDNTVSGNTSDSETKDDTDLKDSENENSISVLRETNKVNELNSDTDQTDNLRTESIDSDSQTLSLKSQDSLKENSLRLGKRSLNEAEKEDDGLNKKIRLSDNVTEKKKRKIKSLVSFEKFMQNKKLKNKLTMSDLEQFCLQKICEAIVHKTDVGELHQTIKKQEQTIENLRKDIQQLTKQTRDLDIVNKKLINELRAQNGIKKPLVPLKITRSVGLQVKLNLGNDLSSRRKTPVVNSRTPTPTSTNNTPRQRSITQTNAGVVRQIATSPRKTTPNTTPILSQALQNSRQVAPTNTPKRGPIRIKSAEPSKPTNPGVIDLTDEDDRAAKSGMPAKTNTAAKTGTAVKTSNKTTTIPQTKTINVVQSKGMSPKVNSSNQNKTVAIGQVKATSLPSGKVGTPTRTVTSLSQGVRLTPTQVKNGSITIPASVVTSNSGTTQLMYVVQPTSSLGQVVNSAAGGPQKAVLLNFQSTNGVLSSTLNGPAVSVIPSKTTNTVQLKTIAAPRKHPASLPLPPPSPINPSLKPLLPKPHLSIRKTDTGIILQWRMPYNLDVYEGIASYQLFAYQETNAPPSTDMWRKVGDVKALALPMACTLTQFADKNKYYFAVRSVDVHKRIGAFSDPEEISL